MTFSETTKLTREFFSQSADVVAPLLLGAEVVHETPQGVVVGRIVETEAYLPSGDPACHASRGMTKRNASMFEPGGISYVYLIYGMYYCFNIVTGKAGCGEAVLVRAVEPLMGIEQMVLRRKTAQKKNLTNGPGKLAQAMGIDKALDGKSLFRGTLRVRPGKSLPTSDRIITTTRIGITAGSELLLRFYEYGNEYVSVVDAQREHSQHGGSDLLS